jgi:hypothetical protein
MEFEAVKPHLGAFTYLCKAFESFITLDPFIVANGDLGGIHERNPCASPETDQSQKHGQRD